MKAIIVALAVFFASVTTLPQNDRFAAFDKNSERFVADVIITAIEELRQSIRDVGLDPYYLEAVEASYELPVPVIFNAAASAEDIRLDGLSNIVVNQVTYGVLSGILTMDLSLPQLSGSVGGAAAEVTIFGNKITGSGSGTAAASDFRVLGSAQVSVSVFGGITVSNVQTEVRLGGIQSNVILNVQDYDLSNYLNTFLSIIIPDIVEEFKDEIGELLAIILEDYINRIL